MKKIFLLLALSIAISCNEKLCGCTPAPKYNWLDILIAKGEDSVGVLETVYSYNYNNMMVFLVNYKQKCCDNYTAQLFDNEGKSLCFPYGGITGKGDMKCEDFDKLKSEEKLFWKK